MAVSYEKKLGVCDTPKINASVEGQNWGSKNMPLFSRVNERVKREYEVQVMMSEMNSREEFKWPTILSPYNNKEG